MKRSLLILALMFSSVFAYAQKRQTPEQRAKLEKHHGFGEIILGTSKSKYSDLKINPSVTLSDTCLETFTRINEDFHFGPYKAWHVYYDYVNDRLEKVYIDFDSQDVNLITKYIVNELTKLYGKPKLQRNISGIVDHAI